MRDFSLRHLLRLTANSEALLSSGKFGKGLWPIDDELGHVLFWLIRFQGLRCGLEVGSGVGYASLWMAKAFREQGGELLCFEYFMPKVEQWERHMERFLGKDSEQTVQIVPSDVSRWLPHAGRRRFDLLFFDQRKQDYLSHLKALIPYLKRGAFVCADNVISHADACQEYLRFVRTDSRFATVTVPLGAGMEISRYLPA